MAAPEGTRSSSGGAADSYVGSLISLTSKSEIRYEGVLFNINSEESNIGLRNVRSFGTEGRKKEGSQIPPSDTVYEYILFRGSDIKDLQVKSSPPVQTAPSVHNDPAIIQSHYPQTGTASTSLPPSGVGSTSEPVLQHSQVGGPSSAFQPLNSQRVASSSAFQSQNSQLGVPSTAFQTQNSQLGGPNPTFQPQNSQLGGPNQTFQPPNSQLGGPSPAFQPQNSPLGVPSPAFQPHNSQLGVPSPAFQPQNSQLGVPSPAFQNNLPLYQPGGNLSPWSPQPPPTTNAARLAMPMYWQGYYASSSGLQSQQQQMLNQPSGLSMPSTMHQPLQYPFLNPNMAGTSNIPTTQFPENRPPPLPSFNGNFMNMQSSATSTESSGVFSHPSTSLLADKGSSTQSPTDILTTSFPLMSSFTSMLDRSNALPPGTDQPKAVFDPVARLTSFPESASSNLGKSTSVLGDGAMPLLVTPGHLLQPLSSIMSSSQTFKTNQKDAVEVQASSSESKLLSDPQATAPVTAPQPTTPASDPTPAPAPAAPSRATDYTEPILPLPSPDHKLNGAPAIKHYGYRGGYERGRGNMVPNRGHGYRGGYERGRGSMVAYRDHGSRGGHDRGRGYARRPATTFTEDFDFTAMNEKFNKDEVWGTLGNSSKAQEDEDDSFDEENGESSKNENKAMYVKDDFFDSLSCDALDGRNNGRTRFSEMVKKDTETFGEFSRHRGGGRGGRGPYRGGYSRGSYNGRGYGHGSREYVPSGHGGREYVPSGRGGSGSGGGKEYVPRGRGNPSTHSRVAQTDG